MNNRPEVPIVVIQTIVVHWTTQSRGGKAAATRNQVPECLELPPALPMPGSVVARQEVQYDERNQFHAPVYQRWLDHGSIGPEQRIFQLYWDEDSGFRMPQVLLSASDGVLHVGFDWTRFSGAPRREPGVDRFALKPGEWVQLRCNARSSGGWEDGKTWAYLKQVANVSYATSFAPALFCANPPTYQRSDMADLW